MPRSRSIVVAALVAVLGSAVRADAVLAPSKGSQLATLFGFGTCPLPGSNPARSAVFSQMVRGDGVVAPFVIPPKQIFVITDVTLSVSAHGAGDTTLSAVLVGTAAGGAPVGARFDTVSAGGTMTAVIEFPAGVPLKSTSVACGAVLNLTSNPVSGVTATAHGFFAPDK